VPLIKFALKAQGVSHIEKDVPCQDSADAVLGLNNTIGIACAADGHGGDKYFRSGRGSHFAVTIALRSLADFYGSVTKRRTAFFDRKAGGEGIKINDMQSKLKQLEANIIYKWRNAVMEDLKNNPLTEAETGTCNDNNIQCDDPVMYGTTLLAALVSDCLWFVLHIGDGLCVVLENEEKIYCPIQEDERLAFGRTTSLCDNDAVNSFRESYGFSQITGLTVATDGMTDSFEPDKYLQFNKELYDKFSRFPAGTEAELKDFLPRLSERGSRDDISIAGIFRIKEPNKVLA
jgi:serine/threonine protein phosphatase PrpC